LRNFQTHLLLIAVVIVAVIVVIIIAVVVALNRLLNEGMVGLHVRQTLLADASRQPSKRGT